MMRISLFLLLFVFSVNLFAEKLPSGLKWITNNDDPVFAAEKVIKGGTFKSAMTSFPLTFRYVGPDSNDAFRNYFDALKYSVTMIHPVTKKFIPCLATHWAYGNDHKTIYFKLDPDAKWSDGKPITADDYVFVLKFMRSKHIVAPWYNNYYTEYFDKIVKYDDYTIGVFGNKRKSNYELMMALGIAPEPKHFFEKGLNKDWVRNFQWKIAPMPGPYYLTKVKKGKSVEFRKVKNWWATNKRYFKNRFNVDKIKIKVIRESSVAYEHFLKGKLDSYNLREPEYWHNKSDVKKIKEFKNGYINKLWFYTDVPAPNMGIFINADYEFFKDINVRKAFGHAMNIDKVIKTVLRGDYIRQNTNQDGRGGYTNKKLRPREFSLKKVDKYMKMAGWSKRGPDGIRVKDGKRMSVVMTNAYPNHEDRIVVLIEEAKKAGIEIKIKKMDGATAFKSLLEKQHQVAYMGWNQGIIPAYWQSFHSDNAHKKQTNNITNTDDKELDKLIMKYRNEFDEKKKQKYSRAVQQRIYDLATYIPTFRRPYERKAYWNWIKLPKIPGVNDPNGAIISPFHIGRFWQDGEQKKITKKALKSGKKLGDPIVVIDKTYKKI